jgi:GTPase SAR1 family protein
LAGGEKFNRSQANYLRGASGALLVCDLTRPVTLKSLSYYAAELWRLSPGVKLLLIGNKRDLVEKQPVRLSQIEAVAASLEAPFYLTSAKTGERVEPVFQHLGRLLLP